MTEHRDWIAGEVLARVDVAAEAPGAGLRRSPGGRGNAGSWLAGFDAVRTLDLDGHARANCHHQGSGAMTSPTDVTTGKKFKPMSKKIAGPLREATARRAQASAEGAGQLQRDVRGDAAECRRRPELVFLSHGGSGDRRHGAGEGVSLREPGGAVPLAYRRGAASSVPVARRPSAAVTTAAKRSRYERLDALPHARYCIACKQREEDGKR